MTDDIKYKCPFCNGNSLRNETHGNITFTNILCSFCKGKKELDWLETIFGVKDFEFRYSTPELHINEDKE